MCIYDFSHDVSLTYYRTDWLFRECPIYVTGRWFKAILCDNWINLFKRKKSSPHPKKKKGKGNDS